MIRFWQHIARNEKKELRLPAIKYGYIWTKEEILKLHVSKLKNTATFKNI